MLSVAALSRVLLPRGRLNYSILVGVTVSTVVIRLLPVPRTARLFGISLCMTLDPVRVTCLVELNLFRRVMFIPSIMVTLGEIREARPVTLFMRPVFTLVIRKCALVPIPSDASGRLTLPPNDLIGVMALFTPDSSDPSRLPAAAPLMELATLTMANGDLSVC